MQWRPLSGVVDSDDILHRSKLSPFRSLGSLDPDERSRLLDDIRSVLTEALEMERQREGGLPPKLASFRWLLEELKVSLFAQELRTPFPVSFKRVERAWSELSR